MKQDLIKDVIQGMLPYLNNAQNEKLQEVLRYTLAKYEVTENQNKERYSEQNYVESFLSAKRIEGCSEKTLKYYKATIEAMLDELQKDVKHIITDDIRGYLTEYQEKKKSSKVTIDNIRRILSSFFSWLEDEDYILKSPVRRIHRVKTGTNIKETSIVTGAVQQKVSQQNLKKVPAIIPSKEALGAFDEITQPIFAQIRNLRDENANLSQLRDTLLPKLMSGELDVSDIEI